MASGGIARRVRVFRAKVSDRVVLLFTRSYLGSVQFINVGCEKSWPKGAPIGGWPTDIEVKLWKVCDDAGEFEDNAALAEFVQQQMQREVDLAYERFDASAQDKKTA